MTEVFSFEEGSIPLLISVPHDGRQLPDEIAARMSTAGHDIPDTDWHVAELYDFALELGASMQVANYSRYVVDLNRPADDEALYEGQVATGLCPTRSFAGDALYLDDGQVGAEERRQRVRAYWMPYHAHIGERLQEIRQTFGYALLWDAHSIPSEVPRLFEGELPVLNIGTNDDRSCSTEISDAILNVANTSQYHSVRNARFKGGYITRHYGEPENRTHAVQLEIAQRAYMDENSRKFDVSKANELRDTLKLMLETYVVVAESHKA
jgi:N-formylglutamate deformylase